MKAIVLTKYAAAGALQLKEVPKPVPGADQVLVKVHAAAVNDWDWSLMRGKPFYIRLLCGLRKPRVKIPGADIAGRVETVGERVEKWQPGDEVYGDISEAGFGGFAEYVCVPARALAPKPGDMSFIQAAALPHAAMLAVQGLRDVGQLQPKQKLLINGAGGGVGTLGVQIAKSLGVRKVVGVDSAEKADMMREIGFARTIDYKQEDFTRSESRYDLILDTKTNRSVFAYLRALTPGGLYVTVGGTTLRLLQAFFLGPLIRKISKKSVRIVALKPNKDLEYINELFNAGKIKPAIDGPHKLSETAEALKYFGEGKHKGKVIITVPDDTQS